MFGFLLTHGQWPMAWPYGQAEGQQKLGLLKGCLYGTQPCGNHYGNLRGTLKKGTLVPRFGRQLESTRKSPHVLT